MRRMRSSSTPPPLPLLLLAQLSLCAALTLARQPVHFAGRLSASLARSHACKDPYLALPGSSRRTPVAQCIHMSGKHNRAYGSWPSEITATFIASSGVRIGNLALGSSKEGGDVALHWLEGRPQEQGRNALVKFVGKGTAGASERGAVDVTPADVNVRSRVHEYGGGAFLIAPQGGVIYSEYTSQRLYWSGRAGDSEPMCLTPESTWKAGRYRFADGQVTPS
eukprot:5060754-Pleurochrysis_carterae.AAC.1